MEGKRSKINETGFTISAAFFDATTVIAADSNGYVGWYQQAF